MDDAGSADGVSGPSHDLNAGLFVDSTDGEPVVGKMSFHGAARGELVLIVVMRGVAVPSADDQTDASSRDICR